jgi:hypothetical protein
MGGFFVGSEGIGDAGEEVIAMKKAKGTVIGFVLVALISLLAFGGIAVDIAAVATARTELRRTTDASSLAGAGKLAFDSSVFNTVRTTAAAYGTNNPTRFGPVNLNLNPSNAPGGDIVLGTWASGAFTPWDGSLNGTQVNAVLCRTTQNVQTWFLRMIGILGLPMTAQSIAVSNPPNSLPPGGCMFPMGITACQFQNAGAWTSIGCGTAMTFATSSGQPPNTIAGTNTAAFVNPYGTGNPSASDLRAWLAAANSGVACQAAPAAGAMVGANNGMLQPVMNDLEGYFITHYNASPVYTVNGYGGTPAYTGQGWEVYVPVIQTNCPPTVIVQDVMIYTFAKFVITQVINGGDCAVNNPNDLNSYPLCPAPNGPNTNPDPSLRAVFGYYDCGVLDTVPTPTPSPRAALADRMRLVQ